MQRVSAAQRTDLDSTGAGVEATREELLEAGARMFAERGYHHTKVEDVVAAAGVAKGTVYWYYRSKKALFLAVLERAATVYREELIETAGPARSPVARLERAVEGTLRFARRRPDLCRLYFQQVHLDDPDFLRRRGEISRGLIDGLKATIRDAVQSGEIPRQDVDLAARMIVGAVEAAVRSALDGGAHRTVAARELRAFVTGALTRGARGGSSP